MTWSELANPNVCFVCDLPIGESEGQALADQGETGAGAGPAAPHMEAVGVGLQ